MGTGLTFGQTFQVKDQHGVPVITISDVKMFRHSEYFKEDIPVFEGVITNISGEDLWGISILGIVDKKDGSIVEFDLASICEQLGSRFGCNFPKDFSLKATHVFMPSGSKPWPFRRSEFESVEFFPDPSWQSPADARLAAEERAKKDAAEAVRQKRIAAEQKKRDAEESLHNAKARMEQAAKDARERERLRAVCFEVYRMTADKKVGDLTVREEQQVRACQALGLYPPK